MDAINRIRKALSMWTFSRHQIITRLGLLFLLIHGGLTAAAQNVATPNADNQSRPTTTSNQQLQGLLKRFPAADINRDGKLTWNEVNTYRKRVTDGGNANGGAQKSFKVHEGWSKPEFPAEALSNQSPNKISQVWKEVSGSAVIPSYEPPKDGALRILGIGHSFMAPGYKTLPLIVRAEGSEQPLHTHIGGGITGSARYKWEQENGIFDFDGRPFPKILSAIANSTWDAMLFGPYYNDRPEYFACWIDFCLKHHPKMKFFISDAWPQLSQFQTQPTSEDAFTDETLDRLGEERRKLSLSQLGPLRRRYPNQVFIMPTSDAMVHAAKAQRRGELPGIDGIHRMVGGNQKSIWRDQLGHLGAELEWLEGYVFYSTVYQRKATSQISIPPTNSKIARVSDELHHVLQEIAWKAVQEHPLSGVASARPSQPESPAESE